MSCITETARPVPKIFWRPVITISTLDFRIPPCVTRTGM